MSASEHLQPKLFHGTGALLDVGDIIEPKALNHLYGRPMAFATKDPLEANEYAYSGMLSKKQLFGAVYEVEPVDPEEYVHEESVNPNHAVSRKGFRIKGIHEWVTANDY